MARRTHNDEHGEEPNHERWLVSYADFVTLLFAFFVVMYAVSSVNQGRYRVLSDSLSEAFAGIHTFNSGTRLNLISPPIPSVPMPMRRVDPSRDRDLAEHAHLQALTQKLHSALSGLIDRGDIRIVGGPHSVGIEINASVLFGVGSASLEAKALPVLDTVGQVLKTLDEPVQVEGHTDDTPIATSQFPSNWELSAARAGSVVRHFVADGLAPARLSAAGYGEFRPIASNSTVDGRARNRRVTLVLLPTLDTPPS